MNKRALFAALALLPIFAQAEIKTIKDVLGREVKVDVPVKRAVLAFYYPDYIAVTGADKFKNVIGISREFWEKFNPGSWAMFKQKLPTLQNIADIGNISTGTFSLEKTLALKPDVLILADWQYKAVATHLPRIKAAGIPIVVVDFNAETVGTRVVRKFSANSTVRRRAPKKLPPNTPEALPTSKNASRAPSSPNRKSISSSATKARPNTATPSAKICGARLPTQQAATISPRLTLKTGDR